MTYEELLKKLIDKDERFMVLTAENRAAIRNLPDQIGDKFLDTGITEMTMVGTAAGLALRGRIPIAHALASFLTMRAFEFIRTDVGISGLPVKLVGGFSGFLSEANGPTHQAIEDVSIMRGIPNVNVFCPADEEDMLIGLSKVLESDSPFYIRYNNLKPAISHSKEFEIGKAEIISEGKDVTILVYGILFKQAIEAKEILEKYGKSVGLINLRT
ncbi:MAG: transketolase C-terminal domain-containing protein, partial [Ignavibacteria bacterium]